MNKQTQTSGEAFAALESWLTAQMETEHGQWLYTHAEHLQDEIRRDQGRAAAIFAKNGRRLWEVKTNNLHLYLGLPSFDAFVSEPDNLLNPATAHLSVQVIDLVVATFLVTPAYIAQYNVENHVTIPTNVLELIGERKYQIITPQIAMIAKQWQRINAYPLAIKQRSNRLECVWQAMRLEVLEWLRKGWALSASDLKTESQFVEGWETYFAQPMRAAYLRSLSRDQLLAIVCPPDVPAHLNLVINVKGRQIKKAKTDEDAAAYAQAEIRVAAQFALIADLTRPA